MVDLQRLTAVEEHAAKRLRLDDDAATAAASTATGDDMQGIDMAGAEPAAVGDQVVGEPSGAGESSDDDSDDALEPLQWINQQRQRGTTPQDVFQMLGFNIQAVLARRDRPMSESELWVMAHQCLMQLLGTRTFLP